MQLQPKQHILHIEGHSLVALSYNADQVGPPIVLLHGITGSVNFWTATHNLAPFLPYGPVYALSLPGHYPAYLPDNWQTQHLTPTNLARWTYSAIRSLVGRRKVILAGHSTGGFLALAVAAQYPDSVRHLISIAGFAQGRWKDILGLGQTIVRVPVIGRPIVNLVIRGAQSNRFTAGQVVARFVAPGNGNRQRYGQLVMRNNFQDLQRLDPSAVAAYFAATPTFDITDQLPNIMCPTLVFAGSRDPIVPLFQSYHIAEHVPQAKLAVIAGVGHVPFFEAPREYNQIVDEWLFSQLKAVTV